MAGVRGFNDPNVQVNKDGSPVWLQLVANQPFSVELVAWNSNGTGLALVDRSTKTCLLPPQPYSLGTLDIKVGVPTMQFSA